jgi:hypothetical protein
LSLLGMERIATSKLQSLDLCVTTRGSALT